MAKIFLAPKELKSPKIKDYIKANNISQYLKDCKEHLDRLCKALHESYKDVCPEAGKVIKFPEGDGYAVYVVARLKPVELVWVDMGDAWQFKYAHRLTASDVREEIRRDESLRKLFSSKKKGA